MDLGHIVNDDGLLDLICRVDNREIGDATTDTMTVCLTGHARGRHPVLRGGLASTSFVDASGLDCRPRGSPDPLRLLLLELVHNPLRDLRVRLAGQGVAVTSSGLAAVDEGPVHRPAAGADGA